MDYTVINLENAHSLQFSELLPWLIHRYGFYGGRGTSYRLDPRDIFRAFYEPQ